MPNPKGQQTTTPQHFPETTPPVPSGDYSYTLEVVMGMQKALGELTQAVRTLTDQGKAQGEKLDAACRDIHAAKVVVGVVGGLIVLGAGFLGWTINAFLQYLSAHPGK